ncbi:MAG TPA: polysaccharide biosynthesis tyrosine autokinase [Terrimicrobiaceae bacterium]
MANTPSDKELSDLLGGTESETSQGLDLGYYFHLLLRYIWLLLAIILLVMAAAAYFALNQPRLYVSTGVLEAEAQEQKVMSSDDIQTVKPDAPDYITTIVAMLTSDSFLVRVAKAAKLLDDPTFFKPKLDGEPYTEPEIAGRMQAVISATPRKLTRLIDVTATDTVPARAQLIAQTVIKEFLLQNIEQRMNIARVASDFLRDESDKLKAKLQQSEEKLQQYKEQQNAVSLESDQNIIVGKLKELSSQVTEANSQRIRLESDIDMLRGIPAEETDRMVQIPSVSSIPQVQTIRGQIVTAEGELAAIQKRYGPSHPKYVQALTQINQLKESLRETLRNAGRILSTQYQSALDTEKKLNESLQEQEQRALQLNKIAIPYNVLTREVESDRIMYDAVNTRLRETTVAMGIEKVPVRIVEEPMAAVAAPRGTLKVLGVGLFLALALGIGSIIGLDMLDSSLRYVDQAESFLKLPVLAVVSKLHGQRGDRIPNAFTDPHSQQAEAFRNMRTALSLLSDQRHRRVFLVTSAVPGEGKTFCAFNAAMSFAIEGQKTALVDADLRMPALHRVFSDADAARRHPGLSDYLAGNSDLDKILMPGPQENLSIICAGSKSPHPGELLSAESFATLIQSLSERFDRVLIDSAPVNAVSDTLRITPLVDYVCLVIRAAKTPKKALARARKLIANARGKLAGFVLNRVHLGRDSAYYFYHYSYGDSEDKGSRASKKNSARA